MPEHERILHLLELHLVGFLLLLLRATRSAERVEEVVVIEVDVQFLGAQTLVFLVEVGNADARLRPTKGGRVEGLVYFFFDFRSWLELWLGFGYSEGS